MRAIPLGFTAAVICAATSASSAETRAQAFAHFPDWTGQWQVDGETVNASGGVDQSFEQAMQPIRRGGLPRFTPQWLPIFAQVTAEARQAEEAMKQGRVNPHLQRMCALGFPQLMINSPLIFEVLTTPEETAMIFSGREMRHIYTDGRAHTPKDELWPTFWGDSVGHWEGQTLVIDTIALNAPPDGRNPPSVFVFGMTEADRYFEVIALFSPEARFIERLRMLDKDHLEDQMTVTDPLALAVPWRLTLKYSRVTSLHRMVHEDCNGEDRDTIVNGQYALAPPLRESAPLQSAPSATSK
jgi:hypothetical protein